MKLMFHKTELEGKYFDDDEINPDYTEKIPPDTKHIWDEKKDEWCLMPEEVIEESMEE